MLPDDARRRRVWAAPLTMAALLAQQVGGNAVRDALFLTWYPVTSLPYVIAIGAAVAIPAAALSGRMLSRFGPARVLPCVLTLNGLLFLINAVLLGSLPRGVALAVYLQPTIIGAIAISAFFSLLNERFDPHSAKPLMARVTSAAAFGGLAGGVAAERVTVLLSTDALLMLLGLTGLASLAGCLVIVRGMPARQAPADDRGSDPGGWAALRQVPLVRDLALVVGLAATVAALVDYLLKAEAVAWLGTGDALVRFFGLFYGGTALAAFLIQALIGRVVLARAGLGGSVALHAVLVGVATVLGFVIPSPWRAVLPRGLDVVVRASVFRAGYELLYTPLSPLVKRAAKSTIDVSIDCFGKGAGAALIVLLTSLAPGAVFAVVNTAGIVAAGAEFAVARRLRAHYVEALAGGLRRQGGQLDAADLQPDLTMMRSLAGIGEASIRLALEQDAAGRGQAALDPLVTAITHLRSGDAARIRHVLRSAPLDPVLSGFIIPLLAERNVLKAAVAALTSIGERGAGQCADALMDRDTPDVIRRRLPLVMRSCRSPLTRDALVHCLSDDSLEVRRRCGLALLAATARWPDLEPPVHRVFEAIEHELRRQSPGSTAAAREHVFNLLALCLEREPVRIAALAFESDDAYLRGTALEYLETVLQPALFTLLAPRLSVDRAGQTPRRVPGAARDELLQVAASRQISRDELQRELSTLGDPER